MWIVNEHMSEVRQFVERLQRELPVHIELVVKTTPSSMHSFYEIGRLLKRAWPFHRDHSGHDFQRT